MHSGNFRIIILHEKELRLAAAALDAAINSQGTDDFSRVATNALNACIVALHGLSKHPSGHVMISSAEQLLGGECPNDSPA